MPPEIWVVFGIDQHGEEFVWPDGTVNKDFIRATKYEAERLNRLGGKVVVERQVWNSPAAAYRRASP